MKAEFKRDMNHNYLILPADGEVDTDSYQVRMMIGNGISSLLKCHVQVIDGAFMIYYDITSRQRMSSFYEEKKMGIEDLRMIFGSFIRVAEEMSEYLLNSGNLVIHPEYMYIDLEKKDILFCYLPGYQKEMKEQFQELTEYILPKIAHGDALAVSLGYGVYRRALEDFFHLEHIKEELFQIRESGKNQDEKAELKTEPKIENKYVVKETEPEEQYMAKPDFSEEFHIQSEEFCKTDKKDNVWKIILGCTAGTAVILIISVLKILGYLSWPETEIILGAVVFCVAAAMLIYIYKSKKNNKKNKESLLEKISLEEISSEETSLKEPLWNEANVQSRTAKEAPLLKNTFTEEEQRENRDYGETVILSVAPVKGPATLVSREPGELATIYLKEEITVIGKMEKAADAVIHLPTVSRMHAKIRKRENEYYLMDLNSRNGTSVNGRMLESGEDYLLKDQDEVDFAQARYVFVKF